MITENDSVVDKIAKKNSTTEDLVKDEFQETQKKCYNLYSRPFSPHRSTDNQADFNYVKKQNQEVLPNVDVKCDLQGVGKSEMIKTSIIAALSMKKKVIICRECS